MAYEILFLIGRILAGGFYLMNGLNHFTKMQMMVGYAQSKGAPLPSLTVPLTGLLLLAGGLSILLGVYPVYGIALISLFFLVVTPLMHNFWAASEKEKMGEMIHFMKNVALLGSTLMLLQIAEPWAYALF